MKLLLDSCTFLWMVADPDQLSVQAKQLLLSPQQEVYFSVVSRWELLVKKTLGGLNLPGRGDEYFDEVVHRFSLIDLPLVKADVGYLPKLPDVHRDPFDRNAFILRA